jgi:calcineurin-like phosphoesterase family protein
MNNWNELVQKDDVVLHLGDFMAGIGSYPNGHKIIKIIAAKLNGNKILVRGNHDYKPEVYYKEELWFTDVVKYFIIDDFFFCHYPLIIFPGDSKKVIAKKKYLLAMFKKEKCKYVIHGHIHSQNANLPMHFNACVDLHQYKPISFESIKESFFRTPK